jgi:hypothetical protein
MSAGERWLKGGWFVAWRARARSASEDQSLISKAALVVVLPLALLTTD